METTIGPARAGDISGIQRLLVDQHLPFDGVTDHLATMLVARQGGRIVGSAALEVYRDGALLRSVAVASELQGRGLGHDLTDAAIRLAREIKMPALYLLTTTAERFFPEFGFERIERHAVPASVQESVEFRSACPSSAAVMRKVLEPLPIVCTLTPSDLQGRRDDLLVGLLKTAERLEATDAGYRFQFAASSQAVAHIGKVIDAERQCCRFLRFQLTVEPDLGPMWLEVSGPPGTADFLTEMLVTGVQPAKSS
jgi:amino-acid N-acetyltransferase